MGRFIALFLVTFLYAAGVVSGFVGYLLFAAVATTYIVVGNLFEVRDILKGENPGDRTTSDEGGADHQSQVGQGARHRRAAAAHCPRRRGDRIDCLSALLRLLTAAYGTKRA
jgi:hypothetical protein